MRFRQLAFYTDSIWFILVPTDKIMAYLDDIRNGLYVPSLLVKTTYWMLVIFRGSNL